MERKQEALDLIVTLAFFTLGIFAARAIVPDIFAYSNCLVYGLIGMAIFLLAETIWFLLTKGRRRE